MNRGNFFAELDRRNVYKVAVAYAVVAWLVIQIATATFPVLELPNWAAKFVIALVAIGFPIALVIAWAFEMTPEGMKRTEDIRPDEKIPQWSRRQFAALIVVVAIAAASLLGYQILRSKATTGSSLSTTLAWVRSMSRKAIAAEADPKRHCCLLRGVDSARFPLGEKRKRSPIHSSSRRGTTAGNFPVRKKPLRELMSG